MRYEVGVLREDRLAPRAYSDVRYRARDLQHKTHCYAVIVHLELRLMDCEGGVAIRRGRHLRTIDKRNAEASAGTRVLEEHIQRASRNERDSRACLERNGFADRIGCRRISGSGFRERTEQDVVQWRIGERSRRPGSEESETGGDCSDTTTATRVEVVEKHGAARSRGRMVETTQEGGHHSILSAQSFEPGIAIRTRLEMR